MDWPGRVCAVLFMSGCNFRCPFCHNHPLVLMPSELKSFTLKEIRGKLSSYKKWLGGVCISGGEPTLSTELSDILHKLKKDGWPIKLDTNGSRPDVLEQLIADELLDMIAMDVKAPLEQEKYARCTGVAVDLQKIEQSIHLIQKSSVPHEFRMTVLPRLHTKDDISNCAASLGGSGLKLQNFNPRTTLNPCFTNEKGFPQADLELMKAQVA